MENISKLIALFKNIQLKCSLKNKNLSFQTTGLTFVFEALLKKYRHVLHDKAIFSNQGGKNTLQPTA